MSGGAGYVLSREAMDRFVLRAMTDPQRCRREADGVEDVEMGQCLAAVGVSAGDSRDEHGRERFHPFTPDLHLIRGSVPHDNWYWQYNYYPAREVCVSVIYPQLSFVLHVTCLKCAIGSDSASCYCCCFLMGNYSINSSVYFTY